MDNFDLILSLDNYEWTLFSIHRLNYYQSEPLLDINELIKEIKLEHEFRTIVDKIIDTY